MHVSRLAVRRRIPGISVDVSTRCTHRAADEVYEVLCMKIEMISFLQSTLVKWGGAGYTSCICQSDTFPAWSEPN